MLIQKVCQRLLAASAVVGDDFGAAGREPLESGVSGDAILVAGSLPARNVAVDLCNDNVVFAGVGVGDFFEDGGEVLAVAAPGGVELDEDVLGLVEGGGGKGCVVEFFDV